MATDRAALPLTLFSHPECVKAIDCAEFAGNLYQQLAIGRYDYPVSVLRFEQPRAKHGFDVYLAEHRTARKRAQHARNLGYRFSRISRSDYCDDIFQINISKRARQGRPMSEGYRRWQEFAPLPTYPCPRHRIDEWGVLKGPRLYAYLVTYTCGDMALVSQILGHGEHMRDDIMYLLAVGAFEQLPKPINVFYNRHDSGRDGLRFFKERLGFNPERVAWRP